MTESYYHLLLTNLISEVESGIRMLDQVQEQEVNSSGLVEVKSILRRAINEAQEGIRNRRKM